MKTRFLISVACSSICAAALTATAASAQVSGAGTTTTAGQSAADSNGNLGVSDEIIVTATRRETRLQETPISVSAVSGADLERNNVREFSDISNNLPNIRAPEGLNGGGNSITIRGITAQARKGAGIEQPAGAYLDQVFVGPRGFLDRVLFDLDRIEVLRGPQGTLWGRNTASGAISYYTRRPTDTFEGYVRGVVGNYDLRNVEAAISGPLAGDQVMFRLSGVHFERDGYTHDIGTGGTFGTENQDAVRAQLRFRPNDDLDIVLIGQYLRSDRNPDAPLWFGLPGYAGPPEFNVGADFKKRRAAVDAPRVVDENLYSLTAIADYKMGDFTLTSVTGYFYGDVYYLVDDESTTFDLAVLGNGTRDNPDDTSRFTQELRLATPRLFNVLEMTLGGYYFLEKNNSNALSRTGTYVFNLLADFGVPPQAVDPRAPDGTVAINSLSHSKSRTESYAAFGQANAYLTDNFWLSAGYRVNYEKKEFKTGDGAIFFGPDGAELLNIPVGDLAAARPFKDTVFTPMLGANYKATDDIFLYATYSEGYKSGGFNTSAIINPEADPFFDPEKVVNYEIGLRTQWLDRRLTLNLTGFYMNYTNLQIERQVANEGVGFSEVVNAGKARSKGLELEAVARVTPNFQLTAAAGYLDAKFLRFETDDGDFSGNRLPFAPKFSSNVGVRYEVPLSGELSAYVQGDWSYSDDYFIEVQNRPLGRQKAHSLFDGRIAVQSESGKWELGLWGRNLTNKLVKVDYNTAVEDNVLLFQGATFAVFAPPRTYGVDLTWRF